MITGYIEVRSVKEVLADAEMALRLGQPVSQEVGDLLADLISTEISMISVFGSECKGYAPMPLSLQLCIQINKESSCKDL